jgi:hypothetical protein
MAKKPDLDPATLQVVKRMLQMPPKPHDEMRVRPKAAKKHGKRKKKA